MNYLVAENVTKSFGERVLFENINLSIGDGQKIALIARNGEGKSTLLKILAGKDSPDIGGSVRWNKDARIAYLPQEPELNDNQSILENVFSGGTAITNAIKNYELALESQAEEDNTATREQLQEATNQMEVLNAWDYEQRISQILTRLNITHLAQQVSTLSGGQRKRIALAKILIEEPDLILLDEPTNHLDLDMIEWLEKYLSRQSLSFLLVTHDRYFLDRITNQIIELDQKQLFHYKGNYEAYLEKKAEREEHAAKDVDKSRNLMRKELEWMRRQPKARGTKSKSRIEAFYDLQERASKQKTETGLNLDMKMSRLGGKIIEMEHVSKSFGSLKILEDFSYIFQKKEKLGIVGHNGVGKTTFLEMITGREQPDSGSIVAGETIVFGYYTQAGIKLPEDKRVIEVVKEIAEVIPSGNGSMVSASQFLQQFGFEPERQYTFVSKLSGGERRRLYLLTILVKNPNFLILDEPTNDLDIVTLNTLEEFLANFPGCLLIVSHDRYFLDKLADHLFLFEGNAVIKDFNGRYSEYRDMIEEEERAAKQPQQKPKEMPAPKAAAPAAKKKMSFKEKHEYETLEKDMELLEKHKKELEAKMTAGEGDHNDFMNWARELEETRQQLEIKTDRWLELSEMM
jgi:ATP-binding cassette subfamily F protein uup